MILKQGHTYRAMPHDGKTIWRIYRGGRCYYKDSPYSLAATQALRAAFPQYWTAIRDYGYAHPALVPFINEDPMLIVSLVEVGKTRWLVNEVDGNYIVTPFLPDYGITYGATVIQYSAEAAKEYSVFGSRTTQNSSFLLQIMDKKWRSQCFGGWTTYGTANINVAYNVEFNFKGIKVDGTQIVSGDYKPSPAITDSIWLVVNNNANAPHGAYFIGGYAEFYRKDENGEITNHLLPFTRNGENGMLDILSGTFHPNANTQGTFTIQVTDKQ